MVTKYVARWIAAVFAVAGLNASAELSLAVDVEDAFQQASVGEEGGLYSPGNGREVLVEYVGSNWRYLLDNLHEIPRKNKKVRGVIRVVGIAAEEFPPMEYLDFLDNFIEVYAEGGIEDDLLRAQLGGVDRKNHFVTVNSAHPRVQKLLLRAKELVPKENVEFQKYLDEELRGEGSDMYMSNKGVDALPPETLPGIKLRKPFESLIEKAKRMTKSSDEATRRNHASAADADESEPDADLPEGGGKGRVWLAAGALAVLIIAMGKVFLKRRPAKGPGS